jgi:catechol 2,3-dioxygenase-like lactoylglutathione lyase family enzyme
MVAVELYVDDVRATAAFFQRYLGFAAERIEDSFAVLWLERTRLLLNSLATEFEEHNPIVQPGASAHRGAGVELVLSMPDLEEVHSALYTANLPYLSDIAEQSWGLRDFRFLLPDGFYVRVTEPDDGVLGH